MARLHLFWVLGSFLCFWFMSSGDFHSTLFSPQSHCAISAFSAPRSCSSLRLSGSGVLSTVTTSNRERPWVKLINYKTNKQKHSGLERQLLLFFQRAQVQLTAPHVAQLTTACGCNPRGSWLLWAPTHITHIHTH